jgi:3-isopropylmalate/(R)-2-methylmalate dehydratase large subunit
VIEGGPTNANTKNLSEYQGLEVHSGYLGSCASGRIEDLRVAAAILKDKKIKSGFQLHVENI